MWTEMVTLYFNVCLLVCSCLVKDFERRPLSFDLLSHEFVRFVPKDPKVVCV